jgi:hypothetical protein
MAGEISAQDVQSLPLKVQRVVPGAGAHLEQTGRAPVPEQVKEAPPLVNLERFLLPAVALGRGGGPVRLAEAGNDLAVLLHGQDRTVAVACIWAARWSRSRRMAAALCAF